MASFVDFWSSFRCVSTARWALDGIFDFFMVNIGIRKLAVAQASLKPAVPIEMVISIGAGFS